MRMRLKGLLYIPESQEFRLNLQDLKRELSFVYLSKISYTLYTVTLF